MSEFHAAGVGGQSRSVRDRATPTPSKSRSSIDRRNTTLFLAEDLDQPLIWPRFGGLGLPLLGIDAVIPRRYNVIAAKVKNPLENGRHAPTSLQLERGFFLAWSMTSAVCEACTISHRFDLGKRSR